MSKPTNAPVPPAAEHDWKYEVWPASSGTYCTVCRIWLRNWDGRSPCEGKISLSAELRRPLASSPPAAELCVWCKRPEAEHGPSGASPMAARCTDRLCPVPGVTSQFYTPPPKAGPPAAELVRQVREALTTDRCECARTVHNTLILSAPRCRWCAAIRALDALAAELEALREVCEAAVRYDESILGRAARGEVDLLKCGSGVADGEDLDALYLDWISKARAALTRRAERPRAS